MHYHRMRDEMWVVLDPGLTVEIGNRVVEAQAGEEFMVAAEETHRIRNVGTTRGPGARDINNRGQVAGLAEATATRQRLPVGLFYPVVWEYGGVRRLPIPTGDNSGLAAAINDNGQVVGASGASRLTFRVPEAIY